MPRYSYWLYRATFPVNECSGGGSSARATPETKGRPASPARTRTLGSFCMLVSSGGLKKGDFRGEIAANMPAGKFLIHGPSQRGPAPIAPRQCTLSPPGTIAVRRSYVPSTVKVPSGNHDDPQPLDP